MLLHFFPSQGPIFSTTSGTNADRNTLFCSKSEFVIYKLKEMGKIAEKDLIQISNQFDLLDSTKCGKITLADLMDSD